MVPELKEKLKTRGQNTTGTKTELIGRLMTAVDPAGAWIDETPGGAFGMDIVGVSANETHVEVVENRMPRKVVDRKQNLTLREAELQRREKELALRELESAWREINRLHLALEAGAVAVRPAEVRRPEQRQMTRNASPNIAINTIAELLSYFDGSGDRFVSGRNR
ncbi:hypothetical protein ALC57_01891 [Trachymyrmex cornetzi]|uniref:SAP domain-containing protein n=1 Tax=Trachymyrmex cornetzi TaxID=471704 RepID=A0A195EK61_9HYME|nr:hypothetical protein ALC57_01891 [Trachymyrmex cornetzi]